MDSLIIHPFELRELIESREGIVLMDIRLREGHDPLTIDGAIWISELELPSQIHRLHDLGRIVVFCGNGKRSRKVAFWLSGLGIEIQFLAGGVERFVAEENGLAERL